MPVPLRQLKTEPEPQSKEPKHVTDLAARMAKKLDIKT